MKPNTDMETLKNATSPQSSARTRHPHNVSSISYNGSNIQEDENLLKGKSSLSPVASHEPSAHHNSHSRLSREDRPKKYSVELRVPPVVQVSFRKKLSNIMKSKLIETLILGLILIYTLLVLVNIALDDGSNDNPDITKALRVLKFVELTILVIFIIEICIRVWASGLQGYFKDLWYVIDAVIVLIALGLVIFDIILDDGSISGLNRVRGLFRLFRIFLLYRKANEVSRITKTKIRTTGIDFKSPIEKVLDLLETFKANTKDKSLIKEIEWHENNITYLISTNQLYEPIIESKDGKPIDKNGVGVWVNSYSTPKAAGSKDLKEIRRASLMPASLARAAVKSVTLVIPEEVNSYLSRDIDQLEFDVLEFSKIAKGDELAYTSLFLFERHNFFEALNIDQDTFIKFIKRVQAGYKPNPYHNSTHAADVLQTTNYFLTTGELLQKCQLNNLEVASLFIGAAIHDFDHPGTNNAFHISTGSIYAIKYNDKAVLENHHVSAVFSLLQNEDYNILANFTKDDYKIIRERIIAVVLATDMSTHFTDIAKLKGRLAADFDIKEKDKKFTMECIVHAADISNPSKPWGICREWTIKIIEEFWNQGDKERALGLPITYLCDRYTVNTAKSQLGFIDFVVSPLFGLLKEILPNIDISYLELNKAQWKELVDFYDQELKEVNEKKKAQEAKEIVGL